MKNVLSIAATAALLATGASAATITATGATSEVIPGPPVLNDTNPSSTDFVKAFTESVSIILDDDLAIAGGLIEAGTRVDSHMVFLNIPNGAPRTTLGYAFSFSETILGVITDTGDLNASTGDLGLAGTVYGTLNGFESRGDSITVGANTISGSLTVTQPGDWFRVITAPAPVPLPAAGWMLVAGVGALAAARKGRK